MGAQKRKLGFFDRIDVAVKVWRAKRAGRNSKSEGAWGGLDCRPFKEDPNYEGKHHKGA